MREREAERMTADTAETTAQRSDEGSPAVSAAPTTHQGILDFVNEVAAMTTPDSIHWCTGSDEEWTELTDALVATGTFTRLDPAIKPNSFYAASDPTDVARVEDRTYICSVDEKDSGPTNNWMDPQEMKAIMRKLYAGCMKGRTMYVIPFVMGHLDAEKPMFGIEVTDSAYVTASMRVMARMGTHVLRRMEELDAAGEDVNFVPALHSVGMPLEDGQDDVAWPCNDTKYIVQFPEERAIWSFGSGYGGNALLGKKCYALRIASVMARDEGWLAEHMLILKLTSPDNVVKYIAAAFPSACGKTNLAMLAPTIPGWKVETLGDDIAWMRVGEDGRLWAVNPEYGFFGVAPGTNEHTNPNAMKTINKGNSVFTNVALTDDGDIWWEGLENTPDKATSWKGQPWTPDSEELSSHPNSRYCTPIKQCDILAEEYDDPRGVPIDAILFGGRRKTTVPLVFEARDWTHGTFLGATLSSETTAAAVGQVGVVRRDPMAMLPFIGYNAGDYFNHWITVGKENDAAKLPRIFYVNWFRRDDEGDFLWPGFGENSRVLKWVVERIEGQAAAVETPIGHVPAPGALDTEGLDLSEDRLAAALEVDVEEWQAELPQIQEWFEKFGDDLPACGPSSTGSGPDSVPDNPPVVPSVDRKGAFWRPRLWDHRLRGSTRGAPGCAATVPTTATSCDPTPRSSMRRSSRRAGSRRAIPRLLRSAPPSTCCSSSAWSVPTAKKGYSAPSTPAQCSPGWWPRSARRARGCSTSRRSGPRPSASWPRSGVDHPRLPAGRSRWSTNRPSNPSSRAWSRSARTRC
jgi:phosphoenolpyruvate carboxykinase (GTP)